MTGNYPNLTKTWFTVEIFTDFYTSNHSFVDSVVSS